MSHGSARWCRPTGGSRRSRIWSVPAPRGEGTYVLEVRASWEPTGSREGSRLGRLIRRRKPAAVTSSAVRRVVFTVIDPAAELSGGRARRARPRNRGRRDRPDAVAQLSAAGRRPIAGGGARPVRLGGSAGGPDRAVAPRSAARLDHAHRRGGGQARPGRRHRAWPGRPSGSRSLIPSGLIV